MNQSTQDPELAVLESFIRQLDSLSNESRARVVRYLKDRFTSDQPQAKLFDFGPGLSVDPGVRADVLRLSGTDIRSLRREKRPQSANEMAALVAYYLGEVAGEGERKETVSQKDIEKYFKQAGFPLPKVPSQTLPNAKSAGYLDSADKPGEYRLNPVGYNLVVHTLPRQGEGRRSGERILPRTKRARRANAK